MMLRSESWMAARLCSRVRTRSPGFSAGPLVAARQLFESEVMNSTRPAASIKLVRLVCAAAVEASPTQASTSQNHCCAALASQHARKQTTPLAKLSAESAPPHRDRS